jgi:site-specific recombinase XerD
MTAMLTLQRRPSKKCRKNTKKSTAPNRRKCRCPVWACGMVDGRRVRISLKTRDLQRAARRLIEIQDRVSGRPRKAIPEAVVAFHAHHDGNQCETKRKYKRILSYLADFCTKESVHYVDSVNVEMMDRYARWRGKGGWAWIKEIELLRQFFEFCRDREWTTKNPARSLKRPIMIEVNDVVPYTQNDIVKIITACDQIGRSSYERRRARAAVLMMRYAGLRISDVGTASRDHIRGNRLEKRAVKNHRMIRVELPTVVLTALDLLPHPKAAAQDNRRFFSKDDAILRSVVKGLWRTLSAVFKRSGVKKVHPHRFRHTLASELLGKGATYEEVAAILGDSPATIRRYYAKWTEEYQSRQDTLIRKIHGTNLAQAEEQVSN